MARRKSSPANASSAPEHDNPAAVDALLDTIDHPLKPVVALVRAAVLRSDRSITEGVKWNSPSFFCEGWFATVNMRDKASLLIVLHHGAKVRTVQTLRTAIKDDDGLLHWHSADRASVRVADESDFAAKRAALVAVIKQWARVQRDRSAG